MRRSITRITATTALLTLAGCGSSTAALTPSRAAATAATASPSPLASATPTPTATSTALSTPTHSSATSPPRTAAPAPAPTPPPRMTMIVVTSATTSAGKAVVAESNGRTLYTFNSDAAGSGMTMCNGACAGEWPPLTIGAGITPMAGPGVTGRLGTLVRSDGRTQVTDNGLALYFYAGDTGPAQTNGGYPGWTIARA